VAAQASPSNVSTVASITGPPIGFSETSSYVRLNFTMFIIQFDKFSGSSVIYAKDGSVLVYYHFMVLQYYNDKVKDWRQAGTFSSLGYNVINDCHYQVVECFEDFSTSPATVYTITYDIKSDCKVKITVRIESGETRQYRLLWSLDGIVYSDWKEMKNTDNVKCQMLFGDESKDYGFVKFDWQDVYEQFRTDVASYSVSTSAQGRKADIYFNLGTVNAGSVLTVDPTVVGTSTTAAAASYPFQRKSFYANGRFWVFYSDGSNMVYRTSSDGITWTSPTTVRTANIGYKFSVWFDGTYLHYAYADDSKIYYRRGVPNSDGSITWSAAEQAVSTTYNTAYYPMVSVDSNGYVWIGYRDYSGSYYYPYVIKSGNNDGTWGTTPSGFPYRFSTDSDASWKVSVVPLTSGKMLAIYAYDGTTVKARRWDGSAWGAEVATTSAIYLGYYHSAVAQGDDVHLVFLKSTGYDILYVKYTYSSNSFGTETTLVSGATSSSVPVISIDTSTNDLYVFAATKTSGTPSGWTANHIYYKKYAASSGTWGSWIDWIDESSEQLYAADRLTCFHKAYDSKIGLVYMTKTSSPYNIKFSCLQLNSPPTIGQFQAPATVYAGEYFFLNATINDADGVAQFVNATVELSNGIILKWDNATNTFSEYRDTYGYCTLDAAGSIKTNLNSTAHRLSWKIKLSWSFPKGYVSILESNTKVFDSGGLSAQGSYTNLFYFDNGGPEAVPEAPEPGALLTPGANCTFVWSFSDPDVGDYPTAFRLQIDDDRDFWTPNIDTGKVSSNSTNVTITLPSKSGNYYWRVMVWDSHNITSEWSSGRLLVIGYKYIFHGPFYENGAAYAGELTVIAYFENYAGDQFTLNGSSLQILYDVKPTVFVFDMGEISRAWYVRDNAEEIIVFVPYDVCNLYAFSIQDYAGLISRGVYFQVDSFINNTFGSQPITRVPASGSINVILQVGRSYLLRLVGPDWTYDFELFVAGTQTSETLTTKPVFADKVVLAYKYILADAVRDNTTITVSYQDNTKNTLSLSLTIRLTNGTVVYAANAAQNLIQWIWTQADPTKGYWIELSINHASMGQLHYSKALPPTTAPTSPWDLSALGSFPIPTNQIFGVVFLLVFAGVFSTMNARYGIVLVCLFAGILCLMGWLNVPSTLLAVAVCLAVMTALGRRHVET
jgi:hypothetical protein